MRLLWHRLTESPEARLNRIRQFGFVRFCAVYALIFPLGHVLASGLRLALTGSSAGLNRMPLELAAWSATGAGVAAVFWLGVALRQRLRAEKVASRSA